MATHDVAQKNPVVDTVKPGAVETPEQKQERINNVIGALHADVLAELYKPSTLVNNLPEDWTRVLNMGAESQSEYSNPTDYKVAVIGDFIRAGVKAQARMAVAAKDNAIAKHSKLHPKLTREECITELEKKQSTRELFRTAVIAEAVIAELK